MVLGMESIQIRFTGEAAQIVLAYPLTYELTITMNANEKTALLEPARRSFLSNGDLYS